MGCRILCEERSDSRRTHRDSGKLDKDQRIAIAARIAAACILDNRAIIYLDSDPGDLTDDALLAEVLKGGSERAGEEMVEVDAQAVQETLTRTGLFTEWGQNRRLGWAHQTYAEFLTAYFLRARGLRLEDLEGILFPSLERVQIVPELREVAAWMASADAEVFGRLARDDPQTLLRSDVAMVDDLEREKLVGALLECFANRELIDVHMGGDAVYRKLEHPRLKEQLEPWIRGRERYFMPRRAAINIAEACKAQALQEALADVALDPADNVNIRAQAAQAVTTIADDATKLRLRPLAYGQAGEDPNDELKGYALTALWPRHMSARELFGCLTRPQREGYTGAYWTFIEYQLEEQLSDEDLTESLAWAERQTPQFDPYDRFAEFIERLIKRAWECVAAPAILPAFVRLAYARFSRRESLLGQRTGSNETKPVRDEQSKRRRFIESFLAFTQPLEHEYRVFHGEGLLAPEDIPWMIDRLGLSISSSTRQRWAILIDNALRHQQPIFDSVNAVAEAMPRLPELQEALKWLNPVELGSPLAEELKKSWLDTETYFIQAQEQRQKCLVPLVRSPANFLRPGLGPVGPVERLIGEVVPEHVLVDLVAQVVLGGEGAAGEHAPIKDAEHAFDLVEPRRVLGREVSSPAGMVVKPVEDVLGVVGREVVADDMTVPGRVTGINGVEQVDERQGLVVLGGKAEELASTDVESSHQGQGSVADVLELAANGAPRLHWQVDVAAFERLHSRLLVHTDDVLVSGRIVIDVQNVVAFGTELVVLRGQPHLLPMRLQGGVLQDALDGGVAEDPTLIPQVLPEQRPRPVRDGNADIAWSTTSFRLYARAILRREREGGRPERGASASRSVGCGPVKRLRHRQMVDGSTPSNIAMCAPAIPSAIHSTAWARCMMRFSTEAGRRAASNRARSSGDNSSSSAQRPGCGRFIHGVGSIMSHPLHRVPKIGQISDEGH